MVTGFNKRAHADVTYTYTGAPFDVAACENATRNYVQHAHCLNGKITATVTVPNRLIKIGEYSYVSLAATSWHVTTPFDSYSNADFIETGYLILNKAGEVEY